MILTMFSVLSMQAQYYSEYYRDFSVFRDLEVDFPAFEMALVPFRNVEIIFKVTENAKIAKIRENSAEIARK